MQNLRKPDKYLIQLLCNYHDSCNNLRAYKAINLRTGTKVYVQSERYNGKAVVWAGHTINADCEVAVLLPNGNIWAFGLDYVFPYESLLEDAPAK